MRRLLILCLCLVLTSTHICAEEGGVEKIDDTSIVRFRLVRPDSSPADSLAPLVVVLPGGARSPAVGSGVRSAFEVLNSATVRRSHPAYILSPRPAAPDDAATGVPVDARTLASALDAILGDYPVDPKRVYVVGELTGADALWTLLSELPGTFAAGVSLGGATSPDVASRLTDVALWVFHGEHDERVPVERVRSMIAAIWSAGAIDVRYTEVRDAGQDIRSAAWAESRLLPWLFSQSRE